jgi:subfamily B ATP-binding cassette protein MsbA
MIQAIQYFKYLKSTNYLSTYARKLEGVIDKTEYLNRKTGYYGAITSGIREPMILLIVVVVIYIQINWMGGNMGSIILSLVLFYRALTFLIQIQSQWQSFINMTGAMSTVADLSQTMDNEVEIDGNRTFKSVEKEIKIENTDLSYGNNKVLNNVNILIPKNKTIALVGASGSGKTTLANIIIGLIFPDTGKVSIDNIPLTNFNLNSYRSKIGYISQDSVVFNDNIYNNITFWAEETAENVKRFWEVIKMASLEEFVSTQPEKEKSPLGDNGILISGGQKQRISIAREMYKREVEILILDEATSALDSETELIIQENIENLHGHYTMIVIAHRLSTIRNVDTIYLLDKGKVTISGNFDFMLQKSDKFKRMVTLQGL